MLSAPSNLDYTPPAWEMQAACRGMDIEIFFPSQGCSLARAKEICSSCPVQAECLELARAAEHYPSQCYGVFGGVAAPDRALQFEARPPRVRTPQVVCGRGHQLRGANVQTRANGRRECRACAVIRAEEKRTRTKCRHGHDYTEDNVYLDGNGFRCCIRCRNDRSREKRRKQRLVREAARA